MLRPITVLALALLTILATVVSAETTDSVRSAMVICTTKKLSDPWALIAQGELIGTRSANRTDYRLKAAGHTFSYVATSNPDGTTSFSAPVSLIRTLIEWPPGHQSPTIPRGPIVVPLNLVPESELPTYGISIN